MKGKCRLCLEERDLVKSHVIPRTFWKRILEGGSFFFQSSTQKDIPTRRAAYQQWEYLLCSRCEARLKDYEDYIVLALFQGKGVRIVRDGNVLICSGFDYAKIRLFQLSILWRASISSLPFFKNVALGPHEERIRGMLNDGDPGLQTLYPCVVAPIFFSERDVKGAADFIGRPESLNPNGIRTFRFEFGSCIWFYIVSSHFDIEKAGGIELVIKMDGSMKLQMRNVRDVKYLSQYFTEIADKGSTLP